MLALEIEFHCLCLFVPDPENNLVHVLMPSTAHDGGNGHSARGAPAATGGHHHVHARHYAWIVHNDLPGNKRVKMEGWSLRLGREGGRPDLRLVPRRPIDGAKLLDLNEHTERSLDPDLLYEQVDTRVMARVTLRDGYLLSAFADTEWLMKGKPFRMASRSTWRIDNFPGGRLDWKRLTAVGKEPLRTFDRLSAPGNVRHVHIFHTTRKGIGDDGTDTSLDFAEVREHFRVYLELYGIGPGDDPQGVLLPNHQNPGLVGVNCPTLKGSAMG